VYGGGAASAASGHSPGTGHGGGPYRRVAPYQRPGGAGHPGAGAGSPPGRPSVYPDGDFQSARSPGTGSPEQSDSLSLTGRIFGQGPDGGASRSSNTKAIVTLAVVLVLLVATGLVLAFFGDSLFAGLFTSG